jgi:hypothetical protein
MCRGPARQLLVAPQLQLRGPLLRAAADVLSIRTRTPQVVARGPLLLLLLLLVLVLPQHVHLLEEADVLRMIRMCPVMMMVMVRGPLFATAGASSIRMRTLMLRGPLLVAVVVVLVVPRQRGRMLATTGVLSSRMRMPVVPPWLVVVPPQHGSMAAAGASPTRMMTMWQVA